MVSTHKKILHCWPYETAAIFSAFLHVYLFKYLTLRTTATNMILKMATRMQLQEQRQTISKWIKVTNGQLRGCITKRSTDSINQGTSAQQYNVITT